MLVSSPTLARWLTLLDTMGLIHGLPVHTAHIPSRHGSIAPGERVVIPYPSLFPERASTITDWPLTWCRVITPGSQKFGGHGAGDGEVQAILCIMGPTRSEVDTP